MSAMGKKHSRKLALRAKECLVLKTENSGGTAEKLYFVPDWDGVFFAFPLRGRGTAIAVDEVLNASSNAIQMFYFRRKKND